MFATEVIMLDNTPDITLFLENDFLNMSHKGVAKYLILRVEIHTVTGERKVTVLYEGLSVDTMFQWLYEKENNLFEEILSANKRNAELPEDERSLWKVYVGIVIMR